MLQSRAGVVAEECAVTSVAAEEATTRSDEGWSATTMQLGTTKIYDPSRMGSDACCGCCRRDHAIEDATTAWKHWSCGERLRMRQLLRRRDEDATEHRALEGDVDDDATYGQETSATIVVPTARSPWPTGYLGRLGNPGPQHYPCGEDSLTARSPWLVKKP
ncbi:hypothetical protein B296_00006324 [Ensete ventricosum]|uniref:Uncharacterized protein n=1 Tax=Ensete ventricosum TaxID=4639 RepID=A0A427B2W3_ENSVE|nr:hypothetical protein B296_00006324 [Ensete ventricosum]